MKSYCSLHKFLLPVSFLLLYLFLNNYQAAATNRQGEQTLFLPFLAKPASCEPFAESYETLPINGPPFGGDAAQNIEFNLGYRGYAPTTTGLNYVVYGPATDTNAPQFSTLFSDERLPLVINAYQRYRWLNGKPSDTYSPYGATVLGLGVTPGEMIHVPDSGYDISGGKDVLVLYAADTRLTLKYTREDSVAVGYTVYIEDICVNASLLALYQTANDAGRNTLPALTGGQPIGQALNGEIKVAMRDSGHFLDPRSCNDWWQAFSPDCNN